MKSPSDGTGSIKVDGVALARPVTRLSRLAPDWQLLLLGAVLLLLIVAAVIGIARRIEQEEMGQFRSELGHLSELVDEVLSRQLQAIDSSLQLLRAEYRDHGGDMARVSGLLRQGPLKGLDVQMTVIGPDGHVVFTDVPGAQPGVYLGDRAHFRFFADGGADQLYISDPVLGRVTKRWGLQLVRPIHDKSGGFIGVVVVFLSPEQLTRFIQPLDVGNDTIMSVLSTRGALLSRSRDWQSHSNFRLSDEQLAEYRRQRSGFVLRSSAVDQVERGLAFRWLQDYPLLLVVSREPTAARAEIRAQQLPMLALGGGSALLLVLGLGWLAHVLRQRRSAELQLLDAHDHLLQAQRIARFGSWDFDLATRALSLSAETYRIFELDDTTTGVAVYAAAMARIHPEDREQAQQIYRAAVRRLLPYDFVHRLLLPDGRVKWIHARGSVSHGLDGRAVRVAGIVQDITERKREEAEREALTRDRLLLLESTGEGIFGIDNKGRCSFINRAGAQMLGYEPGELIGGNMHAITHHHHADGRPYPLEECPIYLASVSGQARRSSDEVFWHKDGRAIPIEYAAYPVVDDDNVSGTVVTFTDISARKLAELELRIAETAFQTQEGMFVTAADGTILRVNQAFVDITGFSAEEAVGRNPRFRSSGRQDAAFYGAMWARLQETGVWKGELWNRRKNGEIYPESVTITAVTGADGQVTHYVATMHDISERKAAEETIRNMAFYDALTQLPNRRLLMDRLQQAQALSARNRAYSALLFIDLDKFKLLNDQHGHDKGDLLLQQVARRLQQCVRESDTVSRLGGDEFVLLLEALSVDVDEARAQAERVGAKVLATLNEDYDLGGLAYHSTPSVGVALFQGRENSGDDLLKQADLAMYNAKAAGRNQLRFFDENLVGE
jgi:diguanylate cyclase (GGDEF)-like protein/PAS domain S-box-containing protein